jgi:hypothetical protein
LFELALYVTHSLFGLKAMSVLRALMIAVVFALAYRFGEGAPQVRLMVVALAFAGAMQTIDLRPSGIAALFVVLAIAAARANHAIAFVILTIFWINVHPSALLAPILAAIVTRRPLIPLSSAAALLVNPFGVNGILAPLKLMTFVGTGAFVNAEWLPSDPRMFPLLYISVILAAIVLMKNRELWRIALAVLFAYLAIRHVRHQPLWYAALPMLIVPKFQIPRALGYGVAAIGVAFAAIHDYTLGVSPSRFPLEAVARLQSTGLRGNIYNPDQFGGFLIWSFYPERRALTDGRNELYHSYIPEYARARRDSRAWTALLDKYRITLAIDEYRAPLDVTDAVTRTTRKLPASLAYWPRREWALIGYDGAAMVFARRAAFPREVISKWELRGVVPDAAR